MGNNSSNNNIGSGSLAGELAATVSMLCRVELFLKPQQRRANRAAAAAAHLGDSPNCRRRKQHTNSKSHRRLLLFISSHIAMGLNSVGGKHRLAADRREFT